MQAFGATLRREYRDASSVQSAYEQPRSTGFDHFSTMAAPIASGQNRVVDHTHRGVA